MLNRFLQNCRLNTYIHLKFRTFYCFYLLKYLLKKYYHWDIKKNYSTFRFKIDLRKST